MMINPLFDTSFLKQLDKEKNRIIYARIIALDQNDTPVEEIQGRVTGGSINIDGSSAVRRSCSISLVALYEDQIITNKYWSLENKFKVEIGLKNFINPNYPDIIWFKQGVFVINNFNYNKSTTALNVSISGQDKMCLLNGTIGGSLMTETDFGTLETEDTDGNIIIEKLTIYNIIKNAILMYGMERIENIVISDLDDVGYELMEYRGEAPLYLFINKTNGAIINMCLDTNSLVKDKNYYSLHTLIKEYNENASEISLNETVKAYVAKIEYGETAGYHQIPLVYPDDLILKVGEPVTNLLDKIKNMLGNYEYFYDIDGRFVFQKKKTYVQELFNPLDGSVNLPLAIASPYAYRFDDEELFTASSSGIKNTNIKNDFSVWGTKKSISGSSLPIHVRYAIDRKPQSYTSPYEHYIKVENLYYIVATEIKKEDLVEGSFAWVYDGVSYIEEQVSVAADAPTYYNLQATREYPLKQKLKDDNTPETDNNGNIVMIPDTSCEVMYKYAANKYCYCEYLGDLGLNYDNFNWKINKTTSIIPINSETIKTKVSTATEKEVVKDELRYIYQLIEEDMAYSIYNGDDWREIIYQMALDYYQHNEDNDYISKITQKNPDLVTQGKTGYEQYYIDLQGFWRQLYNPLTIYDDVLGIEYFDKNADGAYKYWNKNVCTDPGSLLFWFDFLEEGGTGEIGNKFGVRKIGLRTKTDNQSTTTSIFYKDIPEALYRFPNDEYRAKNTAYTVIQLNLNTEDLFSRSTQGISAIERVNDLIYQHTCLGDNLNLTSIPIYYLEPNVRIYVEGEGDCTLDKISYQLTHGGTMSLTCTKITQPFNI